MFILDQKKKKKKKAQIFDEIFCFKATYKKRAILHSAIDQVAKEKWIVCFCVVRSFEKEEFLENSHILSRFVQSKAFF